MKTALNAEKYKFQTYISEQNYLQNTNLLQNGVMIFE